MSVRPSLPPSVRARQSLSPRGLKTFKARSSGTAAPTTMTLGMHICGSENNASVKQNFKFRHMRCTGMLIIFIMSWDFQNPKAPAALSRRRWRIFYEFGDTTSTKKNFQFRRSTAPRAPPTTYPGSFHPFRTQHFEAAERRLARRHATPYFTSGRSQRRN